MDNNIIINNAGNACVRVRDAHCVDYTRVYEKDFFQISLYLSVAALSFADFMTIRNMWFSIHLLCAHYS